LYFLFNRAIRRLPLLAQTQIANNLCLGQINFLLGILPVDSNITKKLEAVMRRIGRKILRIPAKAPNQMVDGELIALPMKATILSNSLRVRETLRLAPAPYDQAPAVRLLTFTDRLPNNGYTITGKVDVNVEKECRPLMRLGQEPITRGIYTSATSLAELPGALLKFKRTIAAASLWASHPRNAALRNPRTATAEAKSALLFSFRPRQLPPTEHLADASCVGLLPPTTDVARFIRATPLSIVAGGWSAGAILHATTIRPPSAGIMLNRMGRAGFGFAPLVTARSTLEPLLAPSSTK
jgi:hypothetical protein